MLYTILSSACESCPAGTEVFTSFEDAYRRGGPQLQVYLLDDGGNGVYWNARLERDGRYYLTRDLKVVSGGVWS